MTSYELLTGYSVQQDLHWGVNMACSNINFSFRRQLNENRNAHCRILFTGKGCYIKDTGDVNRDMLILALKKLFF